VVRLADRLARVEAAVAARARVHPSGCRPGVDFDFERELEHVLSCRVADCARRQEFFYPRSEEHRQRLAELIHAELARRAAERANREEDA
jgi:hypothetical protein